ncbi:hypothetical protein ACX1C1_00810 [Paenibacillus sp. strain BS8-2]
MSNWRGAWFLVKSEIKWAKWKVIYPILFAGYMLLFMISMFDDALLHEGSVFTYMAIDLYALLLFPLLGQMATQPYFTWKADIYTKKLETWRTLPIPIKQIALGKYLLYVTMGIPPMILYFIGFYYAIQSIGPHEMELGAFVMFALFWIVYASVFGFVYLFMELGFRMKVYFWFSISISIVALVALISYSIMVEESLMLESYRTIMSGGWWLPAAAIVAASVLIPLGLRAIERKIRKRNLAK